MMVFVMALRIVRFIIHNNIRNHIIIIIGTLERFCRNNGSWTMTAPADIQCKSCIGDGRPVKVDEYSKFYFYFFFVF
jgi:hypothetical protein